MILVFVGAGGSAAVDPEQYPTTVRFFQKLPKDVKDNGLFQEVCGLLSGKKQIDIEDVLGVLDELQADYQKMLDPEAPLGWSLRTRLGALGYNADQFLGGMGTFAKDAVVPLTTRIKSRVFRTYGTLPKQEKLATWISFLQELSKIDVPIEVFTTNYDLILEEAIQQAEVNIQTGLTDDSRGRGKVLNDTLWNFHVRQMLMDKGDGLLTKLHGSVDWHYLNGEIAVGPPRFTGTLEDHCLLYPGYKGRPTRDPFASFHRHFRSVIRGEHGSLTAAVFIGFAFRDEYISAILDDDLSPQIPFISVTDGIEPPPNAPNTDKGTYLVEGFTQKTAGLVLSMLADAKREET